MESQEDSEKSKNENVLEDFVANLAIEEENQFEMAPREMVVQEDAGDSNPIVIVTEPQSTEKPHEGWGAKFQGFFGKKPDHEPRTPTIQDPTQVPPGALSLPASVIKKLNPFAMRNSEKERKPAPDQLLAPNALERRGGKSFSVKTPPSSRSSKSSIQPGGTREMLDQIEELNLRLGSGMMTPSTTSMPHVYYPGGFSEKAARFPYHLLGNTPFEKRAYMRQLFYVDVNFNPVEFSAKIQSVKTPHMSDTGAGGTWFGTPVPITRKCYQPVLAWIFVFIMIGASTAGIILTIIFGSVQLHRGGEHEFFYLILSATIMISLLMGAFVVETIKICLIGLVFALLDKGMYKRITHRGIKEVK